MEKQLAETGAVWTRVCAIDGKLMSDAEFEKLRPRNWTWLLHGHLPTKGELCCAASHRSAYAEIVENDLDWALVLEDDTELPSGLVAQVEEIEKLTRDYDMIHLHLTRIRGWKRLLKLLPRNRELFEIGGKRTSAAAYIMRRRAAEKHMKAKQIFTGADGHVRLDAIFDLKCAAVLPNVVLPHQETFENSQIDDQGFRKPNRKNWAWVLFIRPFMPLIIKLAKKQLLNS